MYSPDEYFKKLYPNWFSEPSLYDVLIYVFLFFLLMLVIGSCIRFFQGEKRIIYNGGHDIGDEIDFGMNYRKTNKYKIKIRKINNDEWIAYKVYLENDEELPLRRGNLSKIVEYTNRNFGYNNNVIK